MPNVPTEYVFLILVVLTMLVYGCNRATPTPKPVPKPSAAGSPKTTPDADGELVTERTDVGGGLYIDPVANPDGEKWYKVERNGQVYYESQLFRDERAERAQAAVDREKKRSELAIDLDDVSGNSDRLLAAMDEFYDYGDPTYSPGLIFHEAGKRFGFDPEYTQKLISDMHKRGLVKTELIDDPDMHPFDRVDRWRIVKVEK